MHNPSLDELRAERQSARGRIAVVTGKLARANRNAAARQASAARQWVLTGFLRTVVLVVMVRTGGVVDPAVVAGDEQCVGLEHVLVDELLDALERHVERRLAGVPRAEKAEELLAVRRELRAVEEVGEVVELGGVRRSVVRRRVRREAEEDRSINTAPDMWLSSRRVGVHR